MMNDGQLELTAVVLSHDGRQKLRAQGSAKPLRGRILGRTVADRLLADGAASADRCRA